MLTSSFPDKERVELVSQTTRAANSVCSNIAEGTARRTAKDMETVNHIILANDQKYISEDKLYELKEQCLEISKMLSGLKNYFENENI